VGPRAEAASAFGTGIPTAAVSWIRAVVLGEDFLGAEGKGHGDEGEGEEEDGEFHTGGRFLLFLDELEVVEGDLAGAG
jgi:hypothetical protein